MKGYLVAYITQKKESITNKIILTDSYKVFIDDNAKENARSYYHMLLLLDYIYSANLCEIIISTEAHYTGI